MARNKDGLEPGQPVDFETIQRIERQRSTQQPEPEGKPRGRKKTPDAD